MLAKGSSALFGRCCAPGDQGRPPLWESAAGVLTLGSTGSLSASAARSRGPEGGGEALMPWIASLGAVGSDDMMRGSIVRFKRTDV
jgi:hypothetical protein